VTTFDVDRALEIIFKVLGLIVLLTVIAAHISCQQYYEKRKIECGPDTNTFELKRRINRATDSVIDKEFSK
jgi:hypothetical protein